jgi:hypothetical protein
MKKSVVIIIGVIYALSIVFVTLFGLNHNSFNEIIYVSQVEIIDDNASFREDGSKYRMLPVNADGTCEYQLVWTVSPENVSNGNVTFNYDKSLSYVTVDEKGLVTFTGESAYGGQGSVTITITAADGSGQSDSILLIFINQNKK